jgi:hypothetical protein
MGGYYANGKIPFTELVQVGPNHWLTPATAARWKAFQADVLANEGVLLQITPGYNAYRPLDQQVAEKQKACARGRCNDAADPGLSSHGGMFRGTITMAIDVTNWGLIGKAKFYAYARKHGFEPGFFDWEPWHLIDWAPFEMPATAGGSAGFIDLAPLRRRREEDGMYISAEGYTDVYRVDTVWSEAYPMGQVRMRVCGPSEASFANTGGLTVKGYDTVLKQLASDAGYGLPLPTVKRADVEVIMIQDSGAVTYALWGPGFWDDTEGLSPADAASVANGWARLYGNAKNLTYAEWADRKRVGTGGR